jgi:hypothetical protein
MMDAALRAFVRERAGFRCEYCRLHEDDADFLAFHIEHISAIQHGGSDDPDSLGYACSECNWAKGANLSGILNNKLYPLFNPRRQNWKRHFYWDHITLVGKAPRDSNLVKDNGVSVYKPEALARETAASSLAPRACVGNTFEQVFPARILRRRPVWLRFRC